MKDFDTIIKAESPWKPLNLKEIVKYRDMFFFRIVSNYKAGARQTVLSYFWVIFDPFVSIIFFSIIFGKIANIETGETPYLVFNAAAMAGWTYYIGTLTSSVFSLNGEIMLLQKVYFPRVFIPAVPIITQLPNFLIQLVCITILLSIWGYYPSNSYFFLIPIIAIMIMLNMGVGLMITTFMLQFRDFSKVWSYVLKLFPYTVPLAYPINSIPEEFKTLYLLNPVTPLIEGFRNALLNKEIAWSWVLYSFIFSLVILYFGAVIFKAREPNIVDAV